MGLASRFLTACRLAVALLAAGGCEVLLGPPMTSPAQVSLANVSRLSGSWTGTWRNSQGASGTLRVQISPSSTSERLLGSVQFAGGRCPGLAPLDGALTVDNARLIATAQLGAPCGLATLTFVESRSEVPRLTGAFKTDYPESGLFAVYPR